MQPVRSLRTGPITFPFWLRFATAHTAASDGIGEPKKPPCVACYESGKECILTKSRRGGNFRHFRAGSRLGTAAPDNTILTQPDKVFGPQRDVSSDDERSTARDDSGGVLAMELRNPSDALHILALSGDQPRARHSRTSPNGAVVPIVQGSTTTAANQPLESQHHVHPVCTVFDDYELVQRGLLRPSLVSELLLKSVISAVY